VSQEAENGPAVMALVAAGLGNAILPSSLQAIRFEHVIWKTIEIDDRWTETSLNLVLSQARTGRAGPRRLHRVPPAAFMRGLERGPAVWLSTDLISSDTISTHIFFLTNS
jgi:DNA-binding transcriptional LysR family regulator